MPTYTCPVDGAVIARLENGNLEILGNVTMGDDGITCTDHGVPCLQDGVPAPAATATVTAHVGGTELTPGDWLTIEGQHASVYMHHFMYVGNGKFVSRQTSGVILEGRDVYQGKRAFLVHRGGQNAANTARARVGEGGYNVVTNNCEHFCSEVCGLGHHSEQVFVSGGKLAVTVGAALANILNSNSNVRFTSGISGGFSSGGGFSGGMRFNF